MYYIDLYILGSYCEEIRSEYMVKVEKGEKSC